MDQATANQEQVFVVPEAVRPIIDRITEIASLPHVATRVMEVANDPSTGAADLKKVVESDPSLCARVLRNVNSAACGLRAQVTKIQLAITYLGFDQVRNLAMTASVGSMFEDAKNIGLYERRGLWRHMISVAICSRMIASRLKLEQFEDAFLSGLLHDLGIILEDQFLHDQFCKVMLGVGANKTLCQVEQEHLGFDHTILGSALAFKWRFPTLARDAIRYHHKSQDYEGEYPEVVHCVGIANVICTLKGTTSIGHKIIEPPLAAMEGLGLQKADIKVLGEDLDREIALNESLFDV